MLGNMPGPRTEVAGLYSSILHKVVLFDGRSTTTPCWSGKHNLAFSYFADTFICDLGDEYARVHCPHIPDVETEGMRWRQVLTRGFPTYRVGGSLVEDPVSGKIFLFSGSIQMEFLPFDVKGITKSFADIWELRIDLSGENFDAVDIEDEARTAKAGPWQMCFSCGSLGSWKKCGGSCSGRAFFCGHDCLGEGWKEHKKGLQLSKDQVTNNYQYITFYLSSSFDKCWFGVNLSGCYI
ncbi:hypothetical protein GALMADRAFT_727955 [Galerina marginata CBS 339.88]|uniref:MYND-type domain-containing protein n=1 Tax=Galerina marginata (strain CBS 339.88) TaxID=685588 RepID=A0A067T2L8_GALM3|nr:hypothetical protein GALMADRAFT_727955 [Galerina marginata CBS 339.88]